MKLLSKFLEQIVIKDLRKKISKEVPSKCKVLDVGCASGSFESQDIIFGVDIRIERFKESMVRGVNGDATALPLNPVYLTLLSSVELYNIFQTTRKACRKFIVY